MQESDRNIDVNVSMFMVMLMRFVCSPEEGAGCVGVQLQLSGSGPPQSVQPLLGAPV